MAPSEIYKSFYTSLFTSLWALVFARLFTPQRVSKRDLSGQVAIVTGANSGIGLSIATQLARQNATVYLACRSVDRGRKAAEDIVSRVGEKSEGKVHCWELDTSSLTSVRRFCDRWIQEGNEIDMLVHNAGIASPPANSPTATKDGKDLVIVTNFLGSFLMTHLLEPHLSNTARVVLTSSTGHYSATRLLQPAPSPHPQTFLSNLRKCIGTKLNLGSSSAPAYAHSKAQQVLFAHLLQRRFSSDSDHQCSAHSFTPGFTSSAIFGKFDVSWRTWLTNPIFAVLKATERYVAADTDQGSRTGSWLAAEGAAHGGGGYWEWQVKRTSLVEFLRGVLGEEEFMKRSREEWGRWEEGVEIEWDMGVKYDS
ncbi:hypothetical protein BDU57DRAFT_339175 [Ampelomyces quisqualis]|uniref:NAD(P)-binding protein n=1 Tax=Ampelomyces quisqualis TaxID=50730 RepID=A0A6A5QDG3_AMPQU|nr:hypothetical protein BDU57DRAFT_339175 [Ampelomyces quisqualis]